MRALAAGIGLLSTFACAGSDGDEMDPMMPARMAAGDAGVIEGCPPVGEAGTRKGKVLPNVILEDCAGQAVQLHDLCGAKASWLYVFAGW